jgi:hypothetical protein
MDWQEINFMLDDNGERSRTDDVVLIVWEFDRATSKKKAGTLFVPTSSKSI